MTSEQVEIVLVEDNPHDAELTLRALKTFNLTNNLIWLQDGVEALDFIFAQGRYSERSIEDVPKIVLLDLKLPRVSGLEVLEKVKADSRTRNIPVVVLTSSSEERDIVSSYNLGVNSYVVKPVDFDRYVKTVQQLGEYWLVINEWMH